MIGDITARCWTVQITDPGVAQTGRPTQVDETLDSELDEQIPEMEGIQEIGVDEDNRRCKRAGIRGHAP
jgi:hypothetical protein